MGDMWVCGRLWTQDMAVCWLCLGTMFGFALVILSGLREGHEATFGDFLVRISEATATSLVAYRALLHVTDLRTARSQIYLLKDIFFLEVVTTQLSCWLGFFGCIHGDGIDII